MIFRHNCHSSRFKTKWLTTKFDYKDMQQSIYVEIFKLQKNWIYWHVHMGVLNCFCISGEWVRIELAGFLHRFRHHHSGQNSHSTHKVLSALRFPNLLPHCTTVVSYQNESFSSKWELPFLPPSSLELWRKERARKAALILMKNSHFDRTLQ